MLAGQSCASALLQAFKHSSLLHTKSSLSFNKRSAHHVYDDCWCSFNDLGPEAPPEEMCIFEHCPNSDLTPSPPLFWAMTKQTCFFYGRAYTAHRVDVLASSSPTTKRFHEAVSRPLSHQKYISTGQQVLLTSIFPR